MNKKEVNKFLGEYLDTQDVQYMTTIYEPKKVRRGVTRTNAQLRTISDGEIIIEYDCINPMRRYYLTRQAINRLKNDKYNFVVWKADKQKSPHIHIYGIKGLDKVDHDINREYKRQFLIKYGTRECDIDINTKSYQPIAMESKPHFKYGTVKDIVLINHHNGELRNSIDPKILAIARDKVIAREQTKRETSRFTNSYDNDWFVKWITTEPLPKGQRDSVILKNLGILMSQGLVKEEEKVLKKLEKIYNHHVYQLLGSWKKWARDKTFSIMEIIRYCDDHNLEFGSIRSKYNRTDKDIGTTEKTNKIKKVDNNVIRNFG
jgi:hypothetical protein